jgi:glycosyltransferase involved in cell wall biosynthesis
MRVLHVTDTYLPRRGGIELHVADLARQQRRAGHQVDVLTLTRLPGASGPDEPFVLRPSPDAGVPRKAAFVARHRRLGELSGYDVVHGHCSTVSPLVFATLGAASGLPTAVTVHSLWRRYTGLYRAADHLVGWSRWPVAWSAVSTVAAEAVRRAARPGLQVDVVPNGIDLTDWPQRVLRPDPHHLRLVSVMRLAPRKRPLALLRVLQRVEAELRPDVRVSAVVVGDGPLMAPARRFAARHGMEEWLTFTGHLPRTRIDEQLARADVFVAPATLESFGIAALEAAVSGLPVVGRAGTGLSDFVRHGESGLLLRSDAEVARALVALGRGRHLASPPRSALGALAWPAVVERTHALYERAGATSAPASLEEPAS